MTRAIKTRIHNLEENSISAKAGEGHDYDKIVTWGDGNVPAKYLKDGEEITRDQYNREAPTDTKIEIVFGDPIPPRESSDD